MIICPYCSLPARLVDGSVIYPHRPDLKEKLFWQCAPCDAYVGCHSGTDKNLGRLANAGLRLLKSAAHRAFDPRWRDGSMTRSEAYAWLAEVMNMNKNDCHIGMFDEDACEAVINICKEVDANVER